MLTSGSLPGTNVPLPFPEGHRPRVLDFEFNDEGDVLYCWEMEDIRAYLLSWDLMDSSNPVLASSATYICVSAHFEPHCGSPI